MVVVAMDNLQTTTGVSNNISSVRDSSGNTWKKANEETYGAGAAAAGATVGIFYSKIASALSSGSVTAVFSSAVGSKAITGWKYSGTSGSTLSLTRSTTTATAAADPPSMTVTSGSSLEYLFIRGIAKEGRRGSNFTKTTNWNSLASAATTGGAIASNMGVWGEWRILTGLTGTSDPTWQASDNADLLIMLRERNIPTTSAKMEPMFYTRAW